MCMLTWLTILDSHMSKSTGPAVSHDNCYIILLEKAEALASVRSRMRTGRKTESTLCGGKMEMGEEEGKEYARESRSLKTVYVWHQQ